MSRRFGQDPGIPAAPAAGARRGGFTIIELMLVVGLIGIIATIAIPTMLGFKLRAKVAEGRTNLSAIHKAEESYHAEYGTYVSAFPARPLAVGPQAQPWELNPSDNHGFNQIGFAPEGRLYFQYSATSDGASALTIAARSDIDGNGIFNTWGYVKPAPGTGTGVVGPFGTCLPSGVIDPVTRVPNRLNLFGPCDTISGTSAY
jgi:prepilin-type N-terminal cleavage/methylation domain-containing protein